MANFDHPLLIHFNSFFNNFFPHDVYLSQSFYNKLSTTFQSKSPNTCNFESCPKLKSLNFQWWYCFHFWYKCAFPKTKTFSLKSFTIPLSQIFKIPTFCTTCRHVCECGFGFWIEIVLIKRELKVNIFQDFQSPKIKQCLGQAFELWLIQVFIMPIILLDFNYDEWFFYCSL